ncbi:MAG TPA: DUF6266 family protein [Parafilimonas sp.]|nr:DUF6266 family protein [Parafilimonas sp.]
MARNNTGVIGAFIGTIGPVTGFMRNGRNILRTSTSSIKDKRTPLQLEQRAKINTCTHFTKAFSGTGFLNKTFPAYGHTGTGYNRAVSALMSRAVTGVYPGMQLNYPQVLISKGRLPGPQNVKLAKKANNTLQFNFTDNSTDGIASPDDTVILVTYAPGLQQAVFGLHNGFRKDKKAVLNVAALKGYMVEAWIGFLSKDEADASDSVWAGRVMV